MKVSAPFSQQFKSILNQIKFHGCRGILYISTSSIEFKEAMACHAMLPWKWIPNTPWKWQWNPWNSMEISETGTQPTDATYASVTTAPLHSTAIRVANQSESIYQDTQTSTSICPSPSGKIAHVPGRLVVKPRDIPGSSRANILAQVPVPKARVGYKPREIGSNPISGCHLSGNRAGHSCGYP